MHFDGTDGSTTFTDEKGLSWYVFSPTAELDTAQQQFGTASLFLPDLNSSIETDVLPDISTGDWTVECFLRFANDTENILDVLIYDSDFNNSITLAVQNDANTVRLTVYDTSGTSTPILNDVASVTVAATTWYHVAGVREGTVYSTYFNGNRVNTTNVATAMNDTGPNGHVGIVATTVQDLWVDEFRISKIARYSGATYTIPTLAFITD